MGVHRGIPKPPLAGDHSSIQCLHVFKKRLSASLLLVYASSKEGPQIKRRNFFFFVCFFLFSHLNSKCGTSPPRNERTAQMM